MYAYFVGIDIAKNTHWASCLSSDPSVIQSGNFQAKSTRMSKRGSGMLRYSLVYSAHKLVRVIFKILKDNVVFDLD